MLLSQAKSSLAAHPSTSSLVLATAICRSFGLSWCMTFSFGAAAWLCCYFCVYFRWAVARPRVICSKKTEEFVRERMKVLSLVYWPTWWAYPSFPMTLMRAFLQQASKFTYHRQILFLQDGGQVALDWHHGGSSTDDFGLPTVDRPSPSDRPVVVVLPGITGSSCDGYVRHTATTAVQSGYRVVVFNNRGQAGVPVTSPRGYCAANCDDLKEVVLNVQSLYPRSRLFVLGFSMGGMIATHFFGDYCRNRSLGACESRRRLGKRPASYADCSVVAGMCVSISWDGIASQRSLEGDFWSRLLNKHLCRGLVELAKANADSFKPFLDKLPGGLDYVSKSVLIRDFDTRFTAPMFGFSSWSDYYQAASPRRHLSTIDIPVLYIHASDDMFVPAESLPLSDVADSHHVILVVTNAGGHLGFAKGWLPTGDTLIDDVLRQYITAVCPP